jgi:hypothetical protein
MTVQVQEVLNLLAHQFEKFFVIFYVDDLDGGLLLEAKIIFDHLIDRAEIASAYKPAHFPRPEKRFVITDIRQFSQLPEKNMK